LAAKAEAGLAHRTSTLSLSSTLSMDFCNPEKNSRENTFCGKLNQKPKERTFKIAFKRENDEEKKRKFSEMEGFVEPVTQKCTNIMYLFIILL
jgi:hypothetical protein